MKIKDVLFGDSDIIDLVESLRSVPPNLTWDGDMARFNVNEHTFYATVRPATPREEATFTPFFNPLPKVGNVDFSLVQGDTLTQDTVGIVNHGAFKVFGGVAHVASELAKKHGYTVLLCIAKRQHSPTNYQSRVDAYQAITTRVAKDNGMLTTMLYQTSDETVYVVYQHNFHDGIIKVKQHLNNNSTKNG